MIKNLNICFRFAKILDFGFIILLYLFLAMLIAMGLDKIYGKFDSKEADKQSFLVNTIELFIILWVTIIIIYIVRNLIHLIPSPLDKVCGLQHIEITELKNAYFFDILLIYFQKNLTDRMKYLYDREDRDNIIV
jgi:hypothetical protein